MTAQRARPTSGPDRPPRRFAAGRGITLAAILALVITAAWLGLRERAASFVRRADQNVLLVTIDTLRADALGCYGGPAATPTLDALAREGVRFDLAHAHAVVTLPSHASILTGLYPYQHGIRDNSGYALAAGVPTLATALRERGYATGAFVAAFVLDARFGLNAGFQTYDDRLGSTSGPTDISIPERRADLVVAPALDWIRAQPGRWFAWVHVFDPHAPYAPPPPFERDYAGRPYHGEVAYTDAMLGPLFAAARSSARPTLVVATSDHGEGLGDHGELTHGLFAYEPTLRVPLLVAQLGGSLDGRHGGATSAVPARHVDLLPTILDALEIDPPAGLPGRSLIRAPQSDADDEPPSYFEAMSASLNRGWAPLSGVLAGREKFIDLPVAEVYDLAADPGEQTNLADREPVRRRVLQDLFAGFRAAPPGERREIDRDAAERLQALGYVTGTAPHKARYTEDDDPKRLLDLDRAIHRGIELIEAKRLPEAVEIYRQIVTRRPDMSLAYRHLAFLHWELGDPRAAVGALRGALARGLTDPSLRSQLGIYLAETGAPAEAIALLEGAGRESHPDLEALNALGIAYARAGRLDEALKTFDAVLARDADHAMALQNAGSAHLARGDLAAARERFTRALAADAGLAQAYTGLGVVEIKSGRRREALTAWARAVELDPREFDALYNLVLELARNGQVEEARAHAQRFVRTAPPALYGGAIQELRRQFRVR